MGKRCSIRAWRRASLATLLIVFIIGATFQAVPIPLIVVHASAPPGSATIAPSTNWGTFFGTSGDIHIDINRPGIAVRVEIPREFLQGVISTENDTSFIQSDIRNDYFYYSVVDESNHWTYAWHGEPSDGPCFKPNFSLHDPNAPWCVEIWNYLNDPHYRAPINGTDYCAMKFDNGTAVPPNAKYVFSCFSPPKFIRFHNLKSPSVAGIYNFTIFVANHTNTMGYPDFVSPRSAWNKTLFVPVSMSNDPATITGTICDADAPSSTGCTPIRQDKGVVYATNVKTRQIARAFVNREGDFRLTGLAPGDYDVQGSAGFANGVAYSLSPPVPTTVGSGQTKSIPALNLYRAPQVCGSIFYENSAGGPLDSFSDNSNLITAFGPGSDQRIRLNITVEATDSRGHVFRFMGTSSNSSNDPFVITTGSNTTYVGTDPYGTEYAGLPPKTSPNYKLTLHIWVTGYVEKSSDRSITVSSAPESTSLPLRCGDPGTNKVSPQVSTVLVGGLIAGQIQLRALKGCSGNCTETPNLAKQRLGLSSTSEQLFGGNILIEVYDQSGILRGVTVNGTVPTPVGDVSIINFYVIGFSEYFNHTRSGVWDETDYGLTPGNYNVTVYMRGYEQDTHNTPIFQVPQGGPNPTPKIVPMIRGGVFQIGVGSFNNRFGARSTCTIQSAQPWRFLNLSIPIRARVYYYDSGGRLVGFNETLMQTKVSHGVALSFFSVLFTGQNWTVREIWFYGYVPTHVGKDTYSIKAFTLGYIQCLSVSVPNDLGSFARGFVPLLIGNDINMTAVRDDLSSIPEHDHAIAEAFANSDGLQGALPTNMSAKVSSLSLSISGFGAWENVSCIPVPDCLMQSQIGGRVKTSFLGQGHFFYVSPDGTRYFDYGLDVGNYTAEIPEFGFNSITATESQHFESSPLTTGVSFKDLSLEAGFGVTLLTMAMLYVIVPSFVAADALNGTSVPLSWVQVEASSSEFSRAASTLDGQYSGVGALFVPAGSYTVTFSVPCYLTQTVTVSGLGWGGTASPAPTLTPSGTC